MSRSISLELPEVERLSSLLLCSFQVKSPKILEFTQNLGIFGEKNSISWAGATPEILKSTQNRGKKTRGWGNLGSFSLSNPPKNREKSGFCPFFFLIIQFFPVFSWFFLSFQPKSCSRAWRNPRDSTPRLSLPKVGIGAAKFGIFPPENPQISQKFGILRGKVPNF